MSRDLRFRDGQRIQILLSLQVALLGEIHPSVRKIGLDWSDEWLRVVIFHDGEVDEEATESASCVETELSASLPEYEVAVETRRFDAPRPIQSVEGVREWVYARWEPESS